jgi:hypothetical protein
MAASQKRGAQPAPITAKLQINFKLAPLVAIVIRKIMASPLSPVRDASYM